MSSCKYVILCFICAIFAPTELNVVILGNMSQQRGRLQDEREQQALNRETIYKVMANLQRLPCTIVLNDFENWLATASHTVQDPLLADFVTALVAQEHGGKILALSHERPVFPKPANLAWVSFMPVAGFDQAHAVDYLESYLQFRVNRELLAGVATRFAGHPFAMQLLRTSLQDFPVADQENQLRQLLQTRAKPLDLAELENLFQQAYSRLSPAEKAVLHTLALARQPLTAGQVEEIGFADSLRLTTAELAQACDRLTERRHLLQRSQDNYEADELVRQYVDQLLLQRKPYKTGIHRLVLRWYQQHFPPGEIDLLANNPKATAIAGYDELVYHAFALAELDTGKSSESAARLATATSLQLRNWHTLRDANRLMFSQFERGCRLMLKQNSKEATQLYTTCLKNLGDLYVRTAKLARADSVYQKALPLYRQIEARLGEANTLRALGDLYVRTDQLARADSVYQKALPLYRQIEDRLGEANTLQSMGAWYFAKGQPEQAIEQYRLAKALYVKLDEKVGQINCAMRLSDACFKLNQYEASIQNIVTALALGIQIEIPQIEIILRRLVNLRQGMKPAFFDSTALAACATLPPERQAPARQTLQRLFARLDADEASPIEQAQKLIEGEEYEKAATLLQTLVREDSANAQGWYLLARAYYEQKKYAKSIAAYERVSHLTPGNASILGNMGWTHYLMGEHRQSIAKSRAALAIDPQASWARCNLGLALLHLGKVDSAKIEYRTAMAQIDAAEELQRQAIADLEEALQKNPALRGGREILATLRERLALLNRNVESKPR